MAHAAQVVIDSETKEELVIVTGGLVTENGEDYIDTSEILVDGEWVAGNDYLPFDPEKLSLKVDQPFVFRPEGFD